MNWLLIVVILVLLGYTINGYRLGLIKVVFSFAAFIITILASAAITPYMSDFLKDNTPIYSNIKEEASDFFKSREANNTNVEVPAVLTSLFNGENDANPVSTIVEGTNQYFAAALADLIIRIISFTASFIIIAIVLRATVFTLDIISNLPILKGINRYAGLIFGFGQGMIIVWIGFLIITIFGTTDAGRFLFRYIKESPILLYIYNHNILLQIFTKGA